MLRSLLLAVLGFVWPDAIPLTTSPIMRLGSVSPQSTVLSILSEKTPLNHVCPLVQLAHGPMPPRLTGFALTSVLLIGMLITPLDSIFACKIVLPYLLDLPTLPLKTVWLNAQFLVVSRTMLILRLELVWPTVLSLTMRTHPIILVFSFVLLATSGSTAQWEA